MRQLSYTRTRSFKMTILCNTIQKKEEGKLRPSTKNVQNYCHLSDKIISLIILAREHNTRIDSGERNAKR